METDSPLISERTTTRIAILGILVIGLMVTAGVMFNPESTPAPPPLSAEFRAQARATVDAIERLQRYSGALPAFEADKALDGLRELSETVGEDNIYNILATYKHRIQMVNIQPSKKHLDELDKAHQDVFRLELAK